MKRKGIFSLILTMVMVFMLQITVAAAGTVTISHCMITGKDVAVIATGSVAPSDTGLYYLFELKPYEAGVGARTDFCASVAAAETVQFSTPLNFNTASSKLYSRFVVTAYQGGVFVPVSNEMYITNPEAVATKATGYPARSKKGITGDWRYAADFTDLNVGYATYELDISRFFQGTGVNYTYNGKNYSFNAGVVAEYDILCKLFADKGVNVVMTINNSFNAATLDLIPAAGRIPGYTLYAMNVQEQAATEKIEALMSFLASRYSGGAHGTIHSWIIGNEINNNVPWHFAGNMGMAEFANYYAKEFRVCYNAIKSQNAGAKVYINIDQRWTHTDSNKLAYKGKDILDTFAAVVKASGDVDWGLTIHPHSVPLFNVQFWNMPREYKAQRLVDLSDNSKMVCPSNLSVVTNHMALPQLLSPAGTVRSIMISEMGFTSQNAQIPSDQNMQAAAMQYAYKLAAANPFIQAVVIHRHVDHQSEIINDGMAVGIRDINGLPKVAYTVYKYMDQKGTPYDNFALPFIGLSSWSQVGLQ